MDVAAGNMIKIGMTQFAAGRHFNPEFPGTKIGNIDSNAFTNKANQLAQGKSLTPGYVSFCAHLFLENFTDARAGVVEITAANEKFIKTGYVARKTEELPVLTRWFDSADVVPPKAPYLDIILYTSEELKTEGEAIDPADSNWGIISINGITGCKEEPMLPITILRNGLGIDFGGVANPVPIDLKAYARAVAFWSRMALVK
ncbi:DUF3228 family protein [Candidatus Saganbacteria bacterium]|nr:DUF3228 family protein [Candidatus Saganbacteria bacterium]